MITALPIPIKTAKPCVCMYYLTGLGIHTEEPKLGKICQQTYMTAQMSSLPKKNICGFGGPITF